MLVQAIAMTVSYGIFIFSLAIAIDAAAGACADSRLKANVGQ